MAVPSVKEQVVHALNDLDELSLRQVADYVAFLKFRVRLTPPPVVDDKHLAARYQEDADEDYQLAESDMSDYAAQLTAEDQQ